MGLGPMKGPLLTQEGMIHGFWSYGRTNADSEDNVSKRKERKRTL
jgi:hypothetical protein